ncbi:MAG: dTMP kinase [Dehalococcoidia bacterium]|nr:dTMP kinase [Dehalococcoidia bacterium]
MKALFITFEGGEGCGKSTQARLLYQRLKRRGIPALMTREPGGTRLGRLIRGLLKRQVTTSISPEAELLLFNASRAQLVKEVIRPAFKKGMVVICDRFYHSTTAYQGYGRGLDLTIVKAINDFAASGVRPDLTILLDIPPQHGLDRKGYGTEDRFERETARFHKRVRSGYLKLAKTEPERWLVIDGRLPRTEIARRIWQRVEGMLKVRHEKHVTTGTRPGRTD